MKVLSKDYEAEFKLPHHIVVGLFSYVNPLIVTV
jgi:hypothetical protein